MPVARRLKASIEAAWPDVATSPVDRIVIAVGLQVLREIDLLVTIDLAQPRKLESLLRRDGTRSPLAVVQAAAIIIEVKQLDASRFTVVGTQIFPDYGRGKERSVDTQVNDCCTAFGRHRERYDGERFFIHGVGWLTGVPDEKLEGVNPWILGSGAGWLEILDAAAQRSTSLYGEKSLAYRNAIETVCGTLTRKRPLSPRDREKSNALCTDILVDEVIDELAKRAGTAQIRLTGRGGSGKTTTLALLAKGLAQIQEARILILTFHKTLRGDIEHLVDSLIDVRAIKKRIGVETATTFFVCALTELGIPLPMKGEEIDFQALPETLAGAVTTLDRDPENGDAAFLRGVDPKRFAWDYVFIDEAQDWTDSERDFIRALYGVENLVLADGLEQLVRRQTPCNWSDGIPKAKLHNQHLGRSLRMMMNVAAFANAFAREAGLADWKIEPLDKLPGGRIIIALGGEVATLDLIDALGRELAAANARPIDALLCVPPPEVVSAADGSRYAIRAAELNAAGASTWDASNPRVRDEAPANADTWRFVQYDSCRGLEGWVTVAFGLDQLAATKHKHPNLEADADDTPENVVRRWMMIALTRAVHTLVVTIADPQAPLVATLRGAAARMPDGVVEWTTGPNCPATVRASAIPELRGSRG